MTIHNDDEWTRAVADYLRRHPVPPFREDPPIKTRIEEQLKVEEEEESGDTSEED